jgi:uncharacterized membrane protein YcaP (DUF421 family)
MDGMFFESWYGVVRVIVVGSLAYPALIAVLRISGKRTLSKWNAFDLIVTVALGSTLATVLLSKDVKLLEGLAAFALLVGLQFVITWIVVRSGTASDLVKSSPTLLLKKGEFLDDSLISTRVTRSEVYAAIRSSGSGSLAEIEAVVLETDGSFSVIKRSDNEQMDALSDVDGYRSSSGN